MKNVIILVACLFAGFWLAENHLQPTSFSDAVGLESENVLTGSRRHCLQQYTRTSHHRGGPDGPVPQG